MTVTEADLLLRIAKLLQAAGNPGICRGCGLSIVWVKHTNGKKTPYDAFGDTMGTNHFVTCPEREQFRKAHQ